MIHHLDAYNSFSVMNLRNMAQSAFYSSVQNWKIWFSKVIPLPLNRNTGPRFSGFCRVSKIWMLSWWKGFQKRFAKKIKVQLKMTIWMEIHQILWQQDQIFQESLKVPKTLKKFYNKNFAVSSQQDLKKDTFPCNLYQHFYVCMSRYEQEAEQHAARHGLCRQFAGKNWLPAMPKIAGKFVIFAGKNFGMIFWVILDTFGYFLHSFGFFWTFLDTCMLFEISENNIFR